MKLENPPDLRATLGVTALWMALCCARVAAQSVHLDFPPDGAVGVPRSLPLAVRVEDAEGDPLTVTFHGRPRPAMAGRDFTVVVLPDTQWYALLATNGMPSTFTAQTDWIVSNRAARNIAFVAHVGDCVQNGDNGGNPVEWRNATNALYRLEDPVATGLAEGLPYAVAPGNHDQSPFGAVDGTTTFFNQYFGADHFGARPFYGGHYGVNNDNSYVFFSAGGQDFVALFLEYDLVGKGHVLSWADAVLKAHSNRLAIVVSHYMSGSGNPSSFSAQGTRTYDALKGNPNLFLVLCGHVHGEGRRQDVHNGRVVHTVLADYQNAPNGGDGWLRLMEFSPSNNQIRVQTYSPTLGQYQTAEPGAFTLAYPFIRPGAPSVELGARAGIPAGTRVTQGWSGLGSGTQYEWFAVVSDGANATTSEVWTFTTASPGLDFDRDDMPDGWEVKHFGSTNATGGRAGDDWDGDGVPNLGEYRGGTGPTNAASALGFSGAASTTNGGLVLQWQSASNRYYAVRRAARVGGAWTALASNMPATPPLNTYTARVDAATGVVLRVSAGAP